MCFRESEYVSDHVCTRICMEKESQSRLGHRVSATAGLNEMGKKTESSLVWGTFFSKQGHFREILLFYLLLPLSLKKCRFSV